MPDKQHAILSASSSYRWLACPPSALECAKRPDTTSDFAREGTDAHTLCEYKVKKALGRKAQNPTGTLDYYSEEMAECTDDYAQFVMERLAEAKKECKDPIVLVEQRLDFSKWVPDGFGTGDCVIVADDTLTVIDYKHGLGVEVSAEKNPPDDVLCPGGTGPLRRDLRYPKGLHDHLPAKTGQCQYLRND